MDHVLPAPAPAGRQSSDLLPPSFLAASPLRLTHDTPTTTASSDTSSYGSADDSATSSLAVELDFSLPADPLAPLQLSTDSGFGQYELSAANDSQQLVTYSRANSLSYDASTPSTDELVPYSSFTPPLSVGPSPSRPAARRRRPPKRGADPVDEEKRLRRKAMHAATDKNRRLTLAVLSTRLRDAMCCAGLIDVYAEGKIDQSLVLEKAIELVQQMGPASKHAVFGSLATALTTTSVPRPVTSTSHYQALFDQLTLAYRHASAHVMQYEVTFDQDPHFVGTLASKALYDMGGGGFVCDTDYRLRDMFNCKFWESEEYQHHCWQTMKGKQLKHEPFLSREPRVLNEEILPPDADRNLFHSTFLKMRPPETLVYAVVQHAAGYHLWMESIIAIGWVQPTDGRVGRKVIVSCKDASRMLPNYLRHCSDKTRVRDTSMGRDSPIMDPSDPRVELADDCPSWSPHDRSTSVGA